jgi:glycosyltransferase involved in cell wall biosynthesis
MQTRSFLCQRPVRRSCCGLKNSSTHGIYLCEECGGLSCHIHAPLWTDQSRRCFHCFSPTYAIREQQGPLCLLNPALPKRTRRVLLVIDGLYIAGAQRHCLNILDLFRANDFECTVLALEGGGRWADRFAASARRVVIAQHVLSPWSSIRDLFDDDDFELVSGHLSRPIQWVADEIPSGIKCFAHLHSEPSEHETISSKTLLSILPRFERVFTPSQQTLECYQRALCTNGGPNGLASNMKVLPNGFSATDFNSSANNLSFNNTNSRSLRIGIVSRLDHDKFSIPLFLATIDRLLYFTSDISVLVAGDGECKNGLKLALREAGIAHVVHLLGFLEEVSSLYKWADVIFLPSKRESMPYVILEALKASKPLVAPALGFLRDWQAPLQVWTFPPGDSAGAAEAILLAVREHRRREEIHNGIKFQGLQSTNHWSQVALKAYGL